MWERGQSEPDWRAGWSGTSWRTGRWPTSPPYSRASRPGWGRQQFCPRSIYLSIKALRFSIIILRHILGSCWGHENVRTKSYGTGGNHEHWTMKMLPNLKLFLIQVIDLTNIIVKNGLIYFPEFCQVGCHTTNLLLVGLQSWLVSEGWFKGWLGPLMTRWFFASSGRKTRIYSGIILSTSLSCC